jgi:predicted RNA-binding protein YlqC (UPF0109 family)
MYKEMLIFAIKKVVLKPNEVTVNELPGDKKVLEIHVDVEDRGRLIGRDGRTIHALRTLLRAVTPLGEDVTLTVAQ